MQDGFEAWTLNENLSKIGFMPLTCGTECEIAR